MPWNKYGMLQVLNHATAPHGAWPAETHIWQKTLVLFFITSSSRVGQNHIYTVCIRYLWHIVFCTLIKSSSGLKIKPCLFTPFLSHTSQHLRSPTGLQSFTLEQVQADTIITATFTTHIYTHTCTHIRTHKYTHTNTHTHRQANRHSTQRNVRSSASWPSTYAYSDARAHTHTHIHNHILNY
jgi:hypothetical protein